MWLFYMRTSTDKKLCWITIIENDKKETMLQIDYDIDAI